MQVVTPVIRLIAKTVPVLSELEDCESGWFDGLDNLTGQAIIEFAGRECYQSWHRPNPATDTNAAYVASLIKQRHLSVLEHASVTFRFQNVSRSLTHELVRHRHFSYSQLSQRYVDAGELKIVVHPHVQELLDRERAPLEEGAPDVHHFVDERLEDVTEAVRRFYEEVDGALTGKTLKQRRSAARTALPNMTATNIVVTGNLRAWRHFILMRSSEHAELEIRNAAWEVYQKIYAEFPAAFWDFETVLTDTGPHMLISKYGEEE